MRFSIILLVLTLGFEVHSQNRGEFKQFVDRLETDIVFNEYLTASSRVEMIEQLIKEADKLDFEKKAVLLKYAKVNLALAQDQEDKDDALYQFVGLIESCDTTDHNELRIYLGSLLHISSILRENSAFELSYKYIERGIAFIERNGLTHYPWAQDMYNDAGVDLLSMGEIERSRMSMNKALSYEFEEDHLQNAMLEYNFSFLYFELNDLDSAIFRQERACAYLEKIEQLRSFPELYDRYGNALGSLAFFYYSNGNFDLARTKALKAKKAYDQVEEYNSGRYPHLYTLINLSIDSKNEDVSALLNEIELVAGKVESGKFNFYHLLSDAYGALGNSTQEISYLRQAYTQSRSENASLVSKLQKYNSRLQAQILQQEKARFLNEKEVSDRRLYSIISIICLVLISLITILYTLYVKARNRKDLLEKEKRISTIELEKNEIRSKLTESELNEKRLVAAQLASHIKLKHQAESAFLDKIKKLRRMKSQNIETEISELQMKMMNLLSIDQHFEYNVRVNDLDQEFRGKLKMQHPDLSEKELQYCSYLLMNLTAKEIGAITNQSDGAVRVYKNRLKNKLVSEPDVDLVDYLQSI